jgi:Concanavalin A-like lectin/glucanases superfamily
MKYPTKIPFDFANLLRTIAIGALLALAGCGGGSSVQTVQNPNTSTPQAVTYSGPAPASADVQAFKNALWINLRSVSGCGGCHVQGNQSPSFARNDDINLAYQAASSVVDLTTPSKSIMVTKVGSGHHCWLASNSACADQLATWISNWAGVTHTSSAQAVVLQVPPDIAPAGGRALPADPTAFATTVYPVLAQYCYGCHRPNAASPQSPFFATLKTDPNDPGASNPANSASITAAYAEAQQKIDLNNPANSRFVARLRDESHNCWAPDCATSAATMLAAIQAMAGKVPVTNVDPSWVLSKALKLYDGTVASGTGRYEGSLIAKYEFKTGTGTVAYDTSGVEPSIDLTFSGNVQWVGGWGVNIAPGGKLQGTSGASAKLYSQITSTGEFSIEAWVAPANVTQTNAYIASYSGGKTNRNFTLGQSMYNYDFLLQSSHTSANGLPSVSTPNTKQVAQATLQHVVLTYDPVNGRQIYVNGALVASGDPQKGGDFSAWDNTYALVLGNEVSNSNPFSGVLRLVAIYNRALTPAQVGLNYNAGVGERFYLLFNVSAQAGVANAYVMFLVSQYDSYSYLFNAPAFIVLNSTAPPPSFDLKGMRIGVNGQEPAVGQAYATLDLTVNANGYKSGAGFPLSSVGTIIPLSQGPASDLFFLTFEKFGSFSNVRTPGTYAAPPPVDLPLPSDIGVKNYGRVNATLSTMTGVPQGEAKVSALFANLQQSLPPTDDFAAFSASHQVAISQMAIQYCDSLVADPVASAAYFPGFDFSAPPATAFAGNGTNLVISPLLAHALNQNLATNPSSSDVSAELSSLITKLAACGSSCPAGRTAVIVKAVCAAAIGSAATVVE